MSTHHQYDPLPVEGDILWTKFPRVENLGEPGPKPRPALVLFVSEPDRAVVVAYGTSQRTKAEELYAGEFVLDPSDPGFSLSGLAGRTKFDLGRSVVLPFDSKWFGPAPGVHVNSPLPKMGTMHPNFMAAAIAANERIS